ncbi:MAG: tryptophan synthase subunit alpha [Chitinophagaceae bacterium]|nr:MAG: tryptophan synthase subunit alpha [Chitinophagaceae bacterium]
MNRIEKLFQDKEQRILSIYFTAGFPELNDTIRILESLQHADTDMVEIGIPFSDSLADGPVIQEANMRALHNGMSLKLLFAQLRGFRDKINMPVILMGSLNPVMQFGIESFLRSCKDTGIDGVILPDLPVDEYEKNYRTLFESQDIYCIFLVTPETSNERLRKIDSLSGGFIYAVSSSSTTGKEKDMNKQEGYFQKLRQMDLKNPVLVGFGIKDKNTFDTACQYTNGAVIGTAFIKALQTGNNVEEHINSFIKGIKAR